MVTKFNGHKSAPSLLGFYNSKTGVSIMNYATAVEVIKSNPVASAAVVVGVASVAVVKYRSYKKVSSMAARLATIEDQLKAPKP